MKRRLTGRVGVTKGGTASYVEVGGYPFGLPKPIDLDLRKRVKSSWRKAVRTGKQKAQLRFERELAKEERTRAKLAADARAEKTRASVIVLGDRSGETIR